MKTLGLCLDTVGVALSQYGSYDFNSLCVFEGKLLAGSDLGLYQCTGEVDADAVDIASIFTFPSTDAGSKKQKKIRQVVISGWWAGELKIAVLYDEVSGGYYTIPPTGAMQEQTVTVHINSEDYGRYIGLSIENVGGADFSIDSIDMMLIPTVLLPKSSLVLGRGKSLIPYVTGAGTGL
jgi:hypothetical protein